LNIQAQLEDNIKMHNKEIGFEGMGLHFNEEFYLLGYGTV
jgi:hypothetical protein